MLYLAVRPTTLASLFPLLLVLNDASIGKWLIGWVTLLYACLLPACPPACLPACLPIAMCGTQVHAFDCWLLRWVVWLHGG